MADVIRMPRMSDTMEEGVIVGWQKKVGDAVEPGDVLAEVETDKATMELESFQEGVLLYIGIKEGAVPVNGILAVIGEEGEDYKAALSAAEEEEQGGASNEAASTNEAPAKEPEMATASANETQSSTTEASDQRIKASPLAKSIAQEAGISLASISGTGDHGRIVKKDVESFLQGQQAAEKAAPAATTTPETASVPAFRYQANGAPNYQDVPVSQMRKVIARRLGESKFGAPHFYLTVEINMDRATEARKKINEIATTRISFNDLIVKAAAAALRLHPAINSSWLGDKIRTNHDVNIGVAVAVEDGLLVPVIRHADMKTLSQIDVEVRALAAKAKEKKLQPDEMTGNTFTISNLGMFDIEEFTAIINPPDACILAVGSIIEKAIVVEGNLAVGKMMKVTLSCDHRVVDGASGAKFLQSLKGILEDPIRLLV
ncbi:MAG: pyruvate dehydrogenase complex dihydrolipoamide acetyltransferase [Saprospiraceae bacterium]